MQFVKRTRPSTWPEPSRSTQHLDRAFAPIGPHRSLTSSAWAGAARAAGPVGCIGAVVTPALGHPVRRGLLAEAEQTAEDERGKFSGELYERGVSGGPRPDAERLEPAGQADRLHRLPSTGCLRWRTERAVPWGVRCRHQILTNAYTALVTEGTTGEAEWAEIEENARTVTRAGWWIDQRSSEPEDLAELLMAANGADRPTENPFF